MEINSEYTTWFCDNSKALLSLLKSNMFVIHFEMVWLEWDNYALKKVKLRNFVVFASIALGGCLTFMPPAESNPFGDGYYQRDNPFGDGYVQEDNPFGDGYIQRDNPFGDGYVQEDNPFGDGYIQDDNPFGDGYVQDKSVFGFWVW